MIHLYIQRDMMINGTRLIFIDTGADPLYPVEDRDGLWSQGDVQLNMPISTCCSSLVIEHNNELYCTCCGENLLTHKQDEQLTNLITN